MRSSRADGLRSPGAKQSTNQPTAWTRVFAFVVVHFVVEGNPAL